MKFVELLILIVILSLCQVFTQKWNIVKGNGTFLFNGIFPIDDGVDFNMQSGFMMYQAMKFAIKVVNNANDANFLHGYKLGINEVFNVNANSNVQAKILKTFMDRIPILIGPYSAEASFLASILTGTFSQIAISYSATHSDFDEIDHKTENMLRTVSSGKFRIQVALDMLKSLKWNYVVVISSYGHDGQDDSRHFITKLSSIGVCLAIQIDLPSAASESDYIAAFEKLFADDPEKKRNRLKGLILFTNKKDTSGIFSVIKNNTYHNHLVLFCIYGCTSFVEITKGKEDILNGTLSLDIAYEHIPGFKEYYLNLRPNEDSDAEFKKVWESFFNCSLPGTGTARKPCTGDEQFSEEVGYYPQTPVHTVIYAVFAVADAIELFVRRICDQSREWMKNKTSCIVNAADRKTYSHHLHTMLNKMSYIDGMLDDFKTPFIRVNRTIKYHIHQFVLNNGKYENILRASWELYRPSLYMLPEDVLKNAHPNFTFINDSDDHRNLAPLVLCSDPCPMGYIRIKDINLLKSKCCWNCQKCQTNSISVNDSCVPCERTEMVEFNKCKALPEIVASLTGENVDKLLVIYVILIVIGLGLVLFVTGLFIYFNGNRIVRCSGRDLCYMILIGLAMLFFCPVAYVIRPSMLACVFRGALPGMAFLMCYAPLFLRASRIYRIFVHAKTSVSRPALISPQSQIFVVLGIVCVQILLASVWFASKTPAPDFIILPKREFITVQCTGDASAVSMLINLSLSVVFMIFCTILAFKTRHFPKNYNEAKFIGVTLYITCVIWAVFLPTYYLSQDKGLFFREYIISALCIIIGYVTLIGLFGQKVRLLLCPRPSDEDLNNQQMWSFSHSNESHHLEIK